MKLLLDMNLSPRWVTVLADAGLEATHWSDVGRVSAPDIEIAAFAVSEGMIVMTNDLDFGALLSMSRERSPSVVQVRAADLSPEAIGAVVDRAQAVEGRARQRSARHDRIRPRSLAVAADREKCRALKYGRARRRSVGVGWHAHSS